MRDEIWILCGKSAQIFFYEQKKITQMLDTGWQWDCARAISLYARRKLVIARMPSLYLWHVGRAQSLVYKKFRVQSMACEEFFHMYYSIFCFKKIIYFRNRWRPIPKLAKESRFQFLGPSENIVFLIIGYNCNNIVSSIKVIDCV